MLSSNSEISEFCEERVKAVQILLAQNLEKVQIGMNLSQKQKSLINFYIKKVINDSPAYSNKKDFISLENIEGDIVRQCGEKVVVQCNKIIACNLYIENIKKIKHLPYNIQVKNYFIEDFEKVIQSTTKKTKKFFSLQSSQFYKYILTMQLSLIPVGNESIVLSGIPRSLIFKLSIPNIFDFCKVLFQAGGNRPFYEMHFNPYRMNQFNYLGWRSVLFNTTEIIRQNPKVKGVFGGAWFFDPMVLKISPEFKYLHDLINEIGGKVYFCSESPEDKQLAFKMSKVRKKAFEDGKYIPRGYIVIITKHKLFNYFYSDKSHCEH